VEMQTWTRVLWSNFMGFFFAIPLLVISPEGKLVLEYVDGTRELTFDFFFLNLLACVLGVGIAYTAFHFRHLASPTTFGVVGNVNKALSVFASQLLWNADSGQGLFGMAVALSSASFYKPASKQTVNTLKKSWAHKFVAIIFACIVCTLLACSPQMRPREVAQTTSRLPDKHKYHPRVTVLPTEVRAPKIAVVLCGLLRTFRETEVRQRMKTRFLDKLVPGSTHLFLGVEPWEVHQLDPAYLSEVGDVKVIVHSDSTLGLGNYSSERRKQVIQHHRTAYVQFERLESLYNSVLEYEQTHSLHFDWFVRARPDLFFFADAPNILSLPSQEAVYARFSGVYGKAVRDLTTWSALYKKGNPGYCSPCKHINKVCPESCVVIEDYLAYIPRKFADAYFRFFSMEKVSDAAAESELKFACFVPNSIEIALTRHLVEFNVPIKPLQILYSVAREVTENKTVCGRRTTCSLVKHEKNIFSSSTCRATEYYPCLHKRKICQH